MGMSERVAKCFVGEEGQESLKALERYGVKDLEQYETWQLQYYSGSRYPWPYCCKLFERYAAYCKTHEPLEFEDWVGLVDNDPANSEDDSADFDYSVLDEKNSRDINYSYGKSIDTAIDMDGELQTLDC